MLSAGLEIAKRQNKPPGRYQLKKMAMYRDFYINSFMDTENAICKVSI